MSAPSKITRGTTTVFRLNRSQAVRIPKDLAFPEGVKKLTVRRDGNKLVLEPEAASWDAFFAMLPIDDDFVLPDDPPPQSRDYGFD